MKLYSIYHLQSIAHRVMGKYGFLSHFPRKVIKEVRHRHKEIPFRMAERSVRDLRNLLWSSIDNVDSFDLDQLIYCERSSLQEIRALVAIADVDVFVEKGSRIDKYAFHNGTSVYTGVQTFSMLPEKLSHDFSSLREGEDRLAIVIEFFVRKNGSVRSGEIYRAMVHNRAKLIYEPVGDWLEQKGLLPDEVASVADLEEQIRLQDEAAQRLQEFRRKNGALELETIEASPVINDGRVVDLVIRQKNRAHYLIENFMVAANGTMAQFLESQGVPMIQRVVREPEHWPRIVEVAASLGVDLPKEADPRALTDFLIRQRETDPEHFPDFSLTIVKLLGSAEYVCFQPGKQKYGHFGLAIKDYTHSTAPNRRYVDLVTQRLLKAVLKNKNSPYNKRELSQIADWCTDRDKAAKKVERFMGKVVASVLLKGREGEIFEAIVTGATEKGTFVRLLHPPAEGKVMYGEEGMEVGQKVRVRLIKLQPEKGFIDFERAEKMSRAFTKEDQEPQRFLPSRRKERKQLRRRRGWKQ